MKDKKLVEMVAGTLSKPVQAEPWSALAKQLYAKYKQTGREVYLNEGIRTNNKAVELKPDPQFLYLGSLGVMQRARFELNGSMTDLNDAITAMDQWIGLFTSGGRQLGTRIQIPRHSSFSPTWPIHFRPDLS